jgi:hypothetical protein
MKRKQLPLGFLETIKRLAAYEEQIAALVEQKAALSKSLHEAIHAVTGEKATLDGTGEDFATVAAKR